jgi:hypothetical protein
LKARQAECGRTSGLLDRETYGKKNNKSPKKFGRHYYNRRSGAFTSEKNYV